MAEFFAYNKKPYQNITSDTALISASTGSNQLTTVTWLAFHQQL